MHITKIEIENYKSIKHTEVSFTERKPVVLIGKNGSGKTNLLEALSAVFEANSLRGTHIIPKNFRYRVHAEADQEELEQWFPGIGNSVVFVLTNTAGHEIDTLESNKLVPLLKKQTEDLRDTATKLEQAIDSFEEHVSQCIGADSYSLLAFTDEPYFRNRAENAIKSVREWLDKAKDVLSSAKNALVFRHQSRHIADLPLLYISDLALNPVQLPAPSILLNQYIKVDRKGLENALKKVNSELEEDIRIIKQLIEKLTESAETLSDAVKDPNSNFGDDTSFLYSAISLVRRIPAFIPNETQGMFYDREHSRVYYSAEREIAYTYLHRFYTGEDKEELLRSGNIEIPPDSVNDYQKRLNESIPAFDRGNYSLVVDKNEQGQLQIQLKEPISSGELIPLAATSAGRRWYFTFYYLKAEAEGNVLIVDEPASMLYPAAQKEVLNELEELAKNGTIVIFATHSPYMIPKEWSCVNYVEMTNEGSKMESLDLNSLKSLFNDIVETDVFILLSKYDLLSDEEKKNLSQNYAIKLTKNWTVEKAAELMEVSLTTIHNWKGKKKPATLSNLLRAESILRNNVDKIQH